MSRWFPSRSLPVAAGRTAASGPVNRLALGLSSVAGGLSAALVPVLAVFVLPVGDYGAFSLVYLVFAEGWSIQLSAVCDTWARKRAAGTTAGSWADYTGALAAIGAVAALITFALGWPVLGSVLQAAAMAVAVGATLYRQGARYHHALTHGPRSVLPSDVVAVLVLVGAVVGLRSVGQAMLTSLLLAWAVAAVASAAFFMRGALRGAGALTWYRRNARTVRVLLGESLLMDAGATGTPVLVAPILGLHDFGIYRSVSSLSVPVQLLIDPVRPYLSQISLKRLGGPAVMGALLGTAVALGLAGYAMLAYVVPVALSFSPVLMALSAFAVPCGVFLAGQLLTYVLNIVARMRVGHRRLIAGRGIHTLFAVGLPVGGALVGGVEGAIWAFVVTTALTVVIWTALLATGAGGSRPAPVEEPTLGGAVG